MGRNKYTVTTPDGDVLSYHPSEEAARREAATLERRYGGAKRKEMTVEQTGDESYEVSGTRGTLVVGKTGPTDRPWSVANKDAGQPTYFKTFDEAMESARRATLRYSDAPGTAARRAAGGTAEESDAPFARVADDEAPEPPTSPDDVVDNSLPEEGPSAAEIAAEAPVETPSRPRKIRTEQTGDNEFEVSGPMGTIRVWKENTGRKLGKKWRVRADEQGAPTFKAASYEEAIEAAETAHRKAMGSSGGELHFDAFQGMKSGVDRLYNATARRSFVSQTATGERTGGYWGHRYGMILTEEQERWMDETFKGGKYAGQKTGDVLKTLLTEFSEMRNLAIDKELKLKSGRAFDPKSQKKLDILEKRFGITDANRPELASMLNSEADRLVTERMVREVEIANGIRSMNGDLINKKGKILRFWDGVGAWVRKMTLYDTFGGPAYVALNLIGNAITLGVARPKALIDYFISIPQATRKQLRGKRVGWTHDMFNATGLPEHDFISASGRDQIAHGHDLFQSRGGALVGKATGMQLWRDLAVAIDSTLREAVYRDVAQPALRHMHREMRNHVQQTYRKWATDPRRTLNFTEAQLLDAFDTLPSRGMFKPQDLRDLLNKLDPSTAATPATRDLANFADRMARDWAESLNAMNRVAKRETNRIGFPGTQTVADEWIGRFTMFHYYNSRVSRLYFTEALRKPYLMNAYFDLMDYTEQKAEEEGAPPYLKAALAVRNSPYGFATFLNPFGIFGTSWVGDIAEEGDAGNKNLTGLGRMMTEGVELDFLPDNFATDQVENILTGFMTSMPHTVPDSLLYVSGLKGEDARAPGLGFRTYGRMVTDGLNMLIASGADVPFAPKDENGNSLRMPDFDLEGEFFNLIARHASPAFEKVFGPDVAQTVAAITPDASGETQWRAHLINAARELYPEATPEKIHQLVDAADINAEHPVNQLAMDTMQDERLATVFVDDETNPIIRAAIRWVSERVTVTSPKVTGEVAATPSAERDEGQKEISRALYGGGSAESARLEQAINTYRNLGVPPEGEAPNTATEVGKVYADNYQMILRDTEGIAPFLVGNVTVTQEMLNAMDEEQRRIVAQDWLDTMPGSRETMDHYYEQREAFLAEHPDVGGAMGIRNIAESYPTGVEGWVEDTMQINTPYRQWVESIDRSKMTEEDYWGLITGPAAYYAIMGEETGQYDRYADETGVGEFAGSGGMSVDAAAAEDRIERNAMYQEGTSEYIQEAEEDLQKIRAIEEDILTNYGEYWLGQYRQRILTGDAERFDDPVYDAIMARHGMVFPKEGSGAWRAMRWAAAQPEGADTSFPAWREANAAELRAKQYGQIELGPVDLSATVGRTAPPPPAEGTVGGWPVEEPAVATPAAAPAAPAYQSTPTAYSGQAVIPAAPLVNARIAPGDMRDEAIFLQVDANTPMTIIGETMVGGQAWAEVELPGGKRAWILSEYLFLAGP